MAREEVRKGCLILYESPANVFLIPIHTFLPDSKTLFRLVDGEHYQRVLIKVKRT